MAQAIEKPAASLSASARRLWYGRSDRMRATGCVSEQAAGSQDEGPEEEADCECEGRATKEASIGFHYVYLSARFPCTKKPPYDG